MKPRYFSRLLFVAVAALTAFASCRTTEANYKAAYTKALAKQNEGLTEEELTGFAREEAIPRTLYRGDSIRLKPMYVNTVVEEGNRQPAAAFNVVVASFSQKFNAMSALQRVRDAGCGTTRLLIDGKNKYYVSAVSVSTLDSAVTAMRAVEQTPPIALRPPYPYILQKVR